MRLCNRNIVLRDFARGDEEDIVRWMTVQTEWHRYDSPWLAQKDFATFDARRYRAWAKEYLRSPTHWGERATLQVEDRESGRHIGFVSAYYLDKNDEPLPQGQISARRAVGIDICEPDFRGEGRGTNALSLFIAYMLCHGWEPLFLQTWTGNERMMHLAEKLGFRPFRARADIYRSASVSYANVTYSLRREDFHALPLWRRAMVRAQTLFR